MACSCEASAPCEEQTLAVATQQHSATIAQPQEMTMTIKACADCGDTTMAVMPLFIAALLLVALLRAFRRRTPFLTLGLSAGNGHVVRGDPSVADLHHPAGAAGERGIVGDDHQRAPLLPEVGEERHDVAA
jgi:hypothetical protein